MTQKRRIPFSTKAKKQQLQVKRAERQQHSDEDETESKIVQKPGQARDITTTGTRSLNVQPKGVGRSIRDPNRYNLKFHSETAEEIAVLKEEAQKPITPENDEKLELGTDVFYDSGLSFPVRPTWDYNLSAGELDRRENKYFREYVDEIQGRYPSNELSYFELNLETWRQLWRVLEMSDILVVVVDARFPSLLFPPSLYRYVTDKLNVPMILVLNKIDAIPSSLAVAWMRYFESHFPGLHVMPFTSMPSYNLRDPQAVAQGKIAKGQRRRGRMRMAAEGANRLYELCQQICHNQVDLSSWKAKIASELRAKNEDDDDDAEIDVGLLLEEPIKSPRSVEAARERYKNDILTLGCVGQPNVGKSSVINALMGRKVVSVSRTPGHTKHFQTIFLTPTVRLCDCPGLVFPSKVPKVLQVLVGSFPIAQLRVPLSSVAYLAKHLDLSKYLSLKHPSDEDEWSAHDICEAWAISRGFMTARGARPDVHRAANHILRLALDARFPLYIRPPGYALEQTRWKQDPACQEVEHIQALPHAPSHAELNWEVISECEEEEGTGEAVPVSSDSDTEEKLNPDDDEPKAFSNKFAALMQDDD